MPQLDKLSFVTQYFWLTIFFFALYFLVVNFFVISVFKSLKLKNIIYKIWYFFLYRFDYETYSNKNIKIVDTGFRHFYSSLIMNIFNNLNKLLLSFRANTIFAEYENNNSTVHFISSLLLIKNFSKINSLDIDEI